MAKTHGHHHHHPPLWNGALSNQAYTTRVHTMGNVAPTSPPSRDLTWNGVLSNRVMYKGKYHGQCRDHHHPQTVV